MLKEVKGGREEAGTEWLLVTTLVFMMFSTIFWRDLPCGRGGGLLTVFKGILLTGFLGSALSTPLSLSKMTKTQSNEKVTVLSG